MTSRRIADCVPKLQEIWPLHKAACAIIGLRIALSCTSREAIEQRALHAQGREPLTMVNHLRGNAGLSSITEEQNKKCVTWTLNSKHIINDKRTLSEAYDIFIIKDGHAIWDVKADVNDDNQSDYLQVAEIGKSLGLIAGAYFKTPDYPHFEV